MRTLAPTHIGPPPQPLDDAEMHPLDGMVRLPSDGFCGAQTVTRGEWLALHADTYLTAERGASAAGPNSPPATGGCPALGDQGPSYPSKDQTDDFVDTREFRRQERCPEEPAPLMSGPAAAAENAAAVHEGGAVRREGKGRGAPGAAPSRPQTENCPAAAATARGNDQEGTS